MSQFLTTLIIAAIICIIAVLAMSIGYFFNKKKVLTKQCGVCPDKKKDKACEDSSSCQLCGKKADEPKQRHP